VTPRALIALGLLVAGAAALFVLQRNRATTEITPRPLLYLVADTQREIERIPLALTRVSDEDENAVGEKLAKGMGLDREVPGDPDAARIKKYLNEVGARVAVRVHRPAIHYQFYYRPSDSFVNAFAMPGGRIVVGRGILHLMESEDELAAVLGHEIAHVDNRHAIERLQYELQARKLGLEGLYQLGAIGIRLFEAGYTKDQELEADRVGLQYAVEGGYSAGGGIAIAEQFAKLHPDKKAGAKTPIGELAGVPIEALKEYFRSHPPEAERIAEMQKEIAARGWNAGQAQRPFALRTIFVTADARALNQRGEFAKAIEKYREAIQMDKSYLPAREGLATALWRSGDAAAAVTAADDALRIDPGTEPMWLLLARALAFADRRTAPARFDAALHKTPRPGEVLLHRLRVTQIGLRVYGGAGAGITLADYENLLSGEQDMQAQAVMRWRMGRWLYRAGNPEAAMKELEAARQATPENPAMEVDLGLALSELGRQADALSARDRARLGGEASAEVSALEAILMWRTARRDTAKLAFQRAAERDPVFLEPRWAMQNYTPAAAAILDELRLAEIARRKEEEKKRAREEATTPN
jgi:predicted Zn-dependent protease